MSSYLAFLRGINIGGHNVRMEDLRRLFEDMGFSNVRTYIQTGNVLFESPQSDPLKLQTQIQTQLSQKLGYEVATFVRTIKQLEETLKPAPFHRHQLTSDTRHLIVFISRALPTGTKYPVLSPLGDVEVIDSTAGEAFVIRHLIKGKFTNSTFLEKNFGVTTTSRFLHTTQKILAWAQAPGTG